MGPINRGVSSAFDYVAAELALKLVSLDFKGILLDRLIVSFVIDHMIFEVGPEREHLRAVVHCTLDESMLW